MSNVRGVQVIKLHYSADPAKASEEWKEYAKQGYPESKWNREMEMDAHAGALMAVFGKTYKPDTHERVLVPDRSLPMRNGWDFGQGYPARVWFQRTRHNALRIFASLHGEGVQLRPFAERTIGHELAIFGDIFPSRRDYCDPAGNQSKDDGLKSVEVLREFGWVPTWRGSRVDEGLEEIERLLAMTEPETGEPMVLIDPWHNAVLCTAFRSMYKRNAQGEIDRIHPFVDLMDALRYGVLGTKSPERQRIICRGPAFYTNEVSGYGRAPIPTGVHGPEDAFRQAGFLVNGR